MRSTAIANRYAHALFAFAKENNLEKAVLEQTAWYRESVAAATAPILENPKIPRETKEAIIDRLFAGDEKKILFLFIRLLLRKGRIGYLSQIFLLYAKRYESEMGTVRGTLSLAYPLGNDLMERLQSTLEQKIKKKIAFDLVEDPRILGGFIFSTGTELIDASMSGMLASIRGRLSAAPVS